MRFVLLAGLVSFVAAAPVEEKRQTDVAASFAFPSPPAGFTPGAIPKESFTESLVRPTGPRSHQTHATGAPPVPVSSAIVARDDKAPTGTHTPRPHPTGSFTGAVELPTGTLVHSKPTGTIVRPTGTLGRPAGTPRV